MTEKQVVVIDDGVSTAVIIVAGKANLGLIRRSSVFQSVIVMIALQRITLLTSLRRFSAQTILPPSNLSADSESSCPLHEDKEDSTHEQQNETPLFQSQEEESRQLPVGCPEISRERTENRVLLISGSTDARPLAVALAQELREHGFCEALAAGNIAISQFIWGAAIARESILQKKEGDLCFQANHRFWSDRNSTNQLLFTLYLKEKPLEVNPFMEIIRINRDSNLQGVSMSMKAAVSNRGMVDVRAVGILAIARLILASIWTRRLALSYKHDVDCYPSLKPSDRPMIPRNFYQVGLTLVQRSKEDVALDRPELLAIRPVAFSTPLERLPAAEEAFSESVDVELPIVKVAIQTYPDKAAATLMSFLCSTGGVQIFSTGSTANNQAMKAITICRSYVREHKGYDVGFQCIHAPRENRNGECQLVTWLRLIQDTADQLNALAEDKIQFRIGNANDAKMVGKSMAHQIGRSGRLDCMAVGIGAAGRSLVAISHARIYLAQKQLDLVVLPGVHESTNLEDGLPRFLPLKFDILSIKKNS